MAIPKIIHYCWLSDDPYPEKIKSCMESWRKYLPDYEFVHWNFNRFPRGKSIWVDQAFDSGKYAFAADYIRLYAIYNYGGIYLDTDVEVLKSFDNLLEFPYFLGKENSRHGIEAAVFGAEKNMCWIKDCLDYYEGKKFSLGLGKFETLVLPAIMKKRISMNHNLIEIDDLKDYDYNKKEVCILPVDWFSPKHFDTGLIKITENTYAIHHFAGSWKKNTNFMEIVRNFLTKCISEIHKWRISRNARPK